MAEEAARNGARQPAEASRLELELARDTVAVDERTTGLARVLVQVSCIALADDIADLALDAARQHTLGARHDYAIRVLSDPAVFRDAEAYDVVDARLKDLRTRLDAYAPMAADGKGDADGSPPHGGTAVTAGSHGDAGPERFVTKSLPVAAAVTTGLQAIGIVSRVLAREYRISGRAVGVQDFGLDIRLARALRLKQHDDETLEVEVDRTRPAPAAEIANMVWRLADDAALRLLPAIAEAAGELEHASVNAAADASAIEALDAQLLELVRRVPARDDEGQGTVLLDVICDLRARRDELVTARLERAAGCAAARERHTNGVELRADVEAFVADLLTPVDGTTLLARAARGERLRGERQAGKDGTASFTLYARVLAGGIDQTVETKLGPDSWVAIAGSSVEFAFADANGRLLAEGVRSILEASKMTLAKPGSFERQYLDYMGLDRKSRDKLPTPA